MSKPRSRPNSSSKKGNHSKDAEDNLDDLLSGNTLIKKLVRVIIDDFLKQIKGKIKIIINKIPYQEEILNYYYNYPIYSSLILFYVGIVFFPIVVINSFVISFLIQGFIGSFLFILTNFLNVFLIIGIGILSPLMFISIISITSFLMITQVLIIKIYYGDNNGDDDDDGSENGSDNSSLHANKWGIKLIDEYIESYKSKINGIDTIRKIKDIIKVIKVSKRFLLLLSLLKSRAKSM